MGLIEEVLKLQIMFERKSSLGLKAERTALPLAGSQKFIVFQMHCNQWERHLAAIAYLLAGQSGNRT